MNLRIVSLLISSLSLTAITATSQTVNEYYVDGSLPTNGNGTAISPWNKIASAVYRARDTTKDAVIFIKAGIYTVDPADPATQIYIDNTTSGANGKYLTFRTYPGDEGKVIFDGSKLKTTTFYPSMFIISGGEYIRVQNIVFRSFKNTNGQVFNLFNAQNIEIKNCKFDTLRWTTATAELGYARVKDTTRYIDPILITNSTNINIANDTLINSAIGWGEFVKHSGTNSGITIAGLISSNNTGIALSYYVATTGNDVTGSGSLSKPWKSIQKAVDIAAVNNRYSPIQLLNSPITINLRAGTHKPTVNGVFINNGNRPDNTQLLTIRNYNSENVIVDGSLITAKFSALFSLADVKNIRIQGLKLTKMTNDSALQNATPSPGTKDTRFGIIVSGKSGNITIKKNEIYDMAWTRNVSKQKTPTPFDNLNPLVILGTTDTSIRNVIIDSNTVYNNIPGYSEAVTINGNVDSFAVNNNLVFDNANIGIAAAGNYQWIVDDIGFTVTAPYNYSKNGFIRNNTVYRNISPVAVSAGIYLDGSRNVLVRDNESYYNGTGISIGNEQDSSVSGYHLIQSNVFRDNLSAGVYYGSTNSSSWVENCTFKDNTIKNNYILDTALRARANNLYGITNASQRYTETNIYRLRNSIFEQNTIESLSNIVLGFYLTNSNLTLRYNTYYVISEDACQAIFVEDKNNDNVIVLPTDSIYTSFHRYAFQTGFDQESSCEGEDYDPSGCGTGSSGNRSSIPTSVEIIPEDVTLSIYPNPASNELFIKYHSKKSGIANITVSDMSGKRIIQYKQSVTEGSQLIRISNLHNKGIVSGLYLINITSAEKTYIGKIFITH